MSLKLLKWSMSSMATASSVPYRSQRPCSDSSATSKALRFFSFVRESVTLSAVTAAKLASRLL